MQLVPGSREVSWNASGRRPTKSELLRRRVLSLAAYATELRIQTKPSKEELLQRYGTTIVPIPVPLYQGESVQGYSAQFAEWVKARNEDWAKIKANPNMERSLRIMFARQRATEHDSANGETRQESGSARHDASKSSFWKALYTKRYVDLETHQKNHREGKFAQVKTMTKADKIREFGSSVIPIFVPLARGETPEAYEGRFKEWLERERGITFEELKADPDKARERYERIQFAKANATGHERFIAPVDATRKRERAIEVECDDDNGEEAPPSKKPAIFERLGPSSVTSEDDRSDSLSFDRGEDIAAFTVPPSLMNKCSVQLPAEGSPIPDQIAAFVACGCQKCMRNGLLRVSEALSEHTVRKQPEIGEFKQASHEETTVDLNRDRNPRSAAAITKFVMSKPSFAELNSEISSAVKHQPTRLTDDAVERQLFGDYDAINEQILANENVVDASATEIASTRIDDIEGTTQLQDENEEMRELIEEEVNNRNAALALVIFYVWRHAQVDLEGLIEDDRAGHVVHIQRASHRKLADLAKEIEECRTRIASIKSQLDTILAAEYSDDDAGEANRLGELSRVGELLTSTEHELHQLQDQRRRELVTLINFDERIRLLVQALLARVP